MVFMFPWIWLSADPASASIKTAKEVVGPTTLALHKKASLQQFPQHWFQKNLRLHHSTSTGCPLVELAEIRLTDDVLLITHITTIFILLLSTISHSLFASIDSDDTTLGTPS
jgi:hypothetical protein